MRKNTKNWLLIGFISIFSISLTFAVGTDIPVNGTIPQSGETFGTDLNVATESYAENDLSSFTPFQTTTVSTCIYRYANCSAPNTCAANETFQANNNGGNNNGGSIGFGFSNNGQCCRNNTLGGPVCRPAPQFTQSNCPSGSFFASIWQGCCASRIAIACNSGVGSVTVPEIQIEGTKPEGIWLLSAQRDIPTGATTKRADSDTAIIRHDLTAPACVAEATKWSGILGFNSTWAQHVVKINPANRRICQDRITYDGESAVRTDQGSGCDNYGEVLLTDHGQSKTFPIIDRVRNQSTCTTPASGVNIDCSEPIFKYATKLEHRGLELPESNLDSQLPVNEPSVFRADDGELSLKFWAIDIEPTLSCGKSGINWDEVLLDPALGEKKNRLITLQFERKELENSRDLAQAEVYLTKINKLKNLIRQTKDNLKLHIWKEIEIEINKTSSGPNLALNRLETKSKGLLNKRLNDGILDEITNELRKSKFNNNSNIGTITASLNAKNLSILQNIYRVEVPRSIKNLIAVFGMGDIENLYPITQDIADIQIQKTYWENSILAESDFTELIPNWTSQLEIEEASINELYDEYLALKNTLGKSLESQLAVVGESVSGNYNLATILLDIINNAPTVESHIQNLIPKIDPINSKLAEILAAVRVYNPTGAECQSYPNGKPGKPYFPALPNGAAITPRDGPCNNTSGNYNGTAQLSELLTLINTFETSVLVLDSDIDNSGIIGKPVFDFSYFINQDFQNSVLIKDLFQKIQNKITVILSQNTSIQTLEAIVAEKQIQILAKTDLINPLAAEIREIEEREVSQLDPRSVKISHLEIGRCLNSSCTSFSEQETFLKENTPPIVENGGTHYEWNLNAEHFKNDPNHTIFSQSGLYKVVLRIYDRAGFAAIEQVAYIQIHPATTNKELTEASLLSNCIFDTDGNPSNLYANLEDHCNVTFTAKDAFGNLIKEKSLLGLEPKIQDWEGSYDVLAEKGENYFNGIRLTGARKQIRVNKDGTERTVGKVIWSSPTSAEQDLEIKAIIPSVKVITSVDGKAGLMATVTKDLDLVIHKPQVNKRGSVLQSSSQTYEDFIFTIPTKFKPWVFLRLSDNKGDIDPTDPWEVKKDKQFCLYAYASTANKRGDSSAKNLPNNFDTEITGHTDPGVALRNQDLRTPKALTYRSISDWKAEKGGSEGLLGQTICSEIHPESGQSHLAAGFTSNIKYGFIDQLKDETDTSYQKNRILKFPGGNLGLLAGDKCIFPELCPTCDVNDPTCHPADPCGIWPELCEVPCDPITQCCPSEAGPNPEDYPTCQGQTGDQTTCDPITQCCPGEDYYPTCIPPECENLTPTQCLCDIVAPGSCVETTYLTAGFDVEGGFLANNNNFLYIQSADVKDDQATHLGNNTVTDVREEITRNAFKLLRGKTPFDNSGKILDLNNPISEFTPQYISFNLENLSDGGLTFIKGGDVHIGTTTLNGGSHTLVIVDGNLIIDGDIEYGPNATGILGVIMLNSTYQDTPTVGNIFVNNLVKKFVGIYFADGSLMTTLKHNNPSISDSFIGTTINQPGLEKQLILTGTLLTRNTLGGSQLNTPQGPWGEMNLPNAYKYDLHNIRRYSPIFTGSDQDNKFDCTDLNNPIPLTCYENKHSFIIRIDEKIKQSPPPGFKSSSNINF